MYCEWESARAVCCCWLLIAGFSSYLLTFGSPSSDSLSPLPHHPFFTLHHTPFTPPPTPAPRHQQRQPRDGDGLGRRALPVLPGEQPLQVGRGGRLRSPGQSPHQGGCGVVSFCITKSSTFQSPFTYQTTHHPSSVSISSYPLPTSLHPKLTL